MRRTILRGLALATLAGGTAAGCREPVELTLPTAADVEAYYDTGAELAAEMSGNVAVVRVVQPAAQIRRGGSLWARVGPYVYLFTDETRRLLEDYPGIAAVRVETRTAGGQEVARAQLARGELTPVLWRRSLNIAGQARRNGTERPALLEDLIRWGEAHTEYEYDPSYTGRR